MPIIIASALPETLEFVNVSPPSPPPAPQSTDLAFDPFIQIPAGLTNTKMAISASGHIQLPGGSQGSGIISCGLCGLDKNGLIAEPGITGAGVYFGIDVARTALWGFSAFVYWDPTLKALRDVQTSGSPFTGALPMSGSFGGDTGSNGWGDGMRFPSRPFTEGSANGYGSYPNQNPLDPTQPVPLFILVKLYNTVNAFSRSVDLAGTTLPPIKVTLSTFQLEY